MTNFYSNGKLLLTGEYLILDGALSLALPTKYGQSLAVQKINKPLVIWESYTDKNDRWLQIEFDLPKLRIITETFVTEKDGGNDSLAITLQNILFEAREMNREFLNSQQGYLIKTRLTFPKNWGLGSSSTLINNMAQWAKIDAFKLQFKTFGGSGYDIACAQHNTPITYLLKRSQPEVKEVAFDPVFKDQLYFVHLNKKQNSREGITAYQKAKNSITSSLAEVSEITQQISTSTELNEFEELIKSHEAILSKIIRQKPVQENLFSDYFGQTKSLGAWGGDFILATGNTDTPSYFKEKGYETIIPYAEMIL